MTNRVLNVAEKNDAAREIASVLSKGRFQRREGFSKYNKIYTFDCDILGKNCQMIMTSVSGHLMSVDFLPAYRKWTSCDPVNLFDVELQRFVPENFLPIKRTLEREIKGCRDLILWTDGDREGENIASEIVAVCKNVRKTINVHRARFSEITPRSIARACSSLGPICQPVSDAVDTRIEVDLRIGCAFTRFQTMRLTRVFPSVLNGQLISYGPCQFPTLGFVVDRYKQIEAFTAETFYKIKVTHLVDDAKVDFNWRRQRLFNHTCCLVLYQMCLESPEAKVISIQSRSRSKWRPLPLDTVELEKLASRKLRISAHETMRIAEKLYTQGYISYPRTETNIFPASFDLSAIVSQQTPDPAWGGFAANLLADGPNPRQGKKTDNAHPPIHPTKYTNSLQGNEKRLYEFVVRHFLACCSKDAEGQETTVEIDIAGEKFSAQGLMIIARNYLDVYPYDKWTDKSIPVYQLHSTFNPSSIEMVEGQTTPPSLLQESDLIALMDKHGIGTDATHAEHIETIKSRHYVGVQDDGGFVPGELGIGLVEGYDSMGYQLSKPKLRAELESDLKQICAGSKTKDAVLNVTLAKYKQVYQQANSQVTKLDEALSKYFGAAQPYTEERMSVLSDPVRKCPYCRQSNLIIKEKRQGGFMLSCLSYPNCRAMQHFPQCVIGAVPHSTLCSRCQPGPVHCVQFKFKPNSVPHFVPLEYVGCTTCDELLCNSLFFSQIKLGIAPANTSRPAGTSSVVSRQAASSTRPPPASRRPPPSSSSQRPNVGAKHSRSALCRCGLEPVQRTVTRTDSANHGKKFLTCPKPRDQQCGFFEWDDDQSGSGTSSKRTRTMPPPGGSRGGSRGGRGGDTQSRQKKCSICRLPGHSKRTCPNK